LAIYLFSQTKPEFIETRLKEFYKDFAEGHPFIDCKFRSKDFETWPGDIAASVETINKL
jgi:hypothetical protein